MKQTLAAPIPRVMEEILEAVKLISREHVQNHRVEQLIHVPDPRIQEEIVQQNKAEGLEAYRVHGEFIVWWKT